MAQLACLIRLRLRNWRIHIIHTRRDMIIGHHLIWTLYGHWLPNDLRGSVSMEFYDEKFAPLGPIHHGRKPKRLQPNRGELKQFYKQAEPLLNFPIFWIDNAKRQAVAEVIAARNYTVWACAILKNHAHMVIRRHRDDALTMWRETAEAARKKLCDFDDVGAEHPVWSSRPYKVFLKTPDEVHGRIQYVERNPEKEGLPQSSRTTTGRFTIPRCADFPAEFLPAALATRPLLCDISRSLLGTNLRLKFRQGP
jgi:REP element-mobilizing transposase RayT